jgi:phosphoglycolate phosphatase
MNFPSAIVFDLDGTLIDSAPDLKFALNRLLVSEGRRELSLPEVIGMIGDGVPTLVERGYQATGDVPPANELANKVTMFGRDYEINATAHTTLFPGARQALERLQDQGVLLGLCTNKPEQATHEILNTFEIADRFAAIAGGDSLGGIRKPDPRHLMLVLDKMGVQAERAVMVGDSGNDILVAKNAEVKSIAVTFGYCHGPVEDLNADVMIDHFDQLIEALEGMS